MADTQICPQLLAILACPSCHASLRESGKELACANPACALRYPIRAGIPVLLVAEARRAPATGEKIILPATPRSAAGSKRSKPLWRWQSGRT